MISLYNMYPRWLFYALCATSLTMTACEQLMFWQTPSAEEVRREDSQVIARVRDKYLYAEDLKDILPSRINARDSTNIVERYVDSWIKKQLILVRAEEKLNLDEMQIERRVREYKQQLLIYEYEKQLVEKQLSYDDVSEEDIEAYYEKYPNSFELKQNIVQGIYLKIPKEVSREEKVREWLMQPTEKNQDKLRSFAYTYADVALLNDSIWIDFDELISNTPFANQLPNRVQALKSRRLLEASDSLYQYYIRIKDYKISEQLSPLEFVKDQIKDILLNHRKIQLVRQNENDIYLQAQRSKEYEIYGKE